MEEWTRTTGKGKWRLCEFNDFRDWTKPTQSLNSLDQKSNYVLSFLRQCLEDQPGMTTPGSLHNTEYTKATSSLKNEYIKTIRGSVWIQSCHIMSPEVSQKELRWAAQLGVKLVDQVRGWGVRVCPGQENSRMAFKQSSFWRHVFWHKASYILNSTHKCLSQQHSLLLHKDHSPALSHHVVGECDHTKGQTAAFGVQAC